MNTTKQDLIEKLNTIAQQSSNVARALEKYCNSPDFILSGALAVEVIELQIRTLTEELEKAETKTVQEPIMTTHQAKAEIIDGEPFRLIIEGRQVTGEIRIAGLDQSKPGFVNIPGVGIVGNGTFVPITIGGTDSEHE